jgi:hypothetical protein
MAALKLLLFVLMSIKVVSSQSQIDQEPIKCQLSVKGSGDRLGIAQANLSCQGGTITAAAHPLLLPHVQRATGVQWSNGSTCQTMCMLSVCGSPRQVHFEPVVVTNLHATSGTWLGGVLCFLKTVTAVVSRADFSYNQAGFLGVSDAQVTLLNSTSRHNIATGTSHFAAVGAVRAARVAITGCTLVNNRQNVTGGSVVSAFDNATLSITNSTFSQNVALCTTEVRCGGGGIRIQGSAKGEPRLSARPWLCPLALCCCCMNSKAQRLWCPY